jgi:hypothetical protein
MTITLTVRDFYDRSLHTNQPWSGVFFVSGILWLDTSTARLYSWQDDRSIPLSDPDACSILRSHFSTDYLGGALLQARVQQDIKGLEFDRVYWVICGDIDHDPPSKWGEKINIHPVPEEYDYAR